MTTQTFKQQLEQLNHEIKEMYSDNVEEVYPIYDGPMDPEAYLENSSYKIMWLMKEPYEEGEREGDWSLPEFYQEDYPGFLQKIIFGKSGRTWQPVVYASHGILNDFQIWDDMPDISKDDTMVNVLGKIAWVNIQKLPSLTGTNTDFNNIYEAYTKNKNLLHKQIELLNPDVIICGNTFQVVKDYWGNPELEIFDAVEYFSSNDKLIINAYHPAQYTISRERYVNSIIECVKQWSEKNKQS